MLKMLGFRHALLIEANPTPFFQLKQNWKDAPYATVVNCAILDTNGPVEFTITNQGESSSLLKPARALEELFIKEQLVFKEEGIITVPGRTLDYLLKEWNMLPQWFNVLVIDIQGAELLALKGAASLLPHLDMVNIEVNFEELYRNGAQIDEIDDFLAPYRFRRVYTVSTRRAWADALYVKEQFAGSVRVETPSCLSLLFGGDASPVKLAIHPNVSI
jgi:FkbM family methyltransferase